MIVSSDTTGIDLDNMQQALIKVTGGMTLAQRDIQVAQAELFALAQELFALAQKLAQTDGELANTARRLDVVHDYWSGFSRGLQDTEHEVFEGKSGMLLKKAETRPRQLPALPSSPRPHSTNAQRICDPGEPMPARPSTSMM